MIWKLAGIFIFLATGISWLLVKLLGFTLLHIGYLGKDITQLASQAQILLPVGLFLIVLKTPGTPKGYIFPAAIAIVFWYAAHIWLGLI